jgi:hypothetical protein
VNLSYHHDRDTKPDLNVELAFPLLEYAGVHEKGRFSQTVIRNENFNYGGSNHLLGSVDFPVTKSINRVAYEVMGSYSLTNWIPPLDHVITQKATIYISYHMRTSRFIK